MTLADMIPQMSAADLGSLHANARRLSDSPGPQQAAAVALLPALEQEVAAREAATPAKLLKVPAVRKSRAKKVPVAD